MSVIVAVACAFAALWPAGASAEQVGWLDPPASCLDYARTGDRLEVRLQGSNDVGVRGYRPAEVQGWRPVGSTDIVPGRLALFISSTSTVHGCFPKYLDSSGEEKWAISADGSGPRGVTYALDGVRELRIVAAPGAEVHGIGFSELVRLEREFPDLHVTFDLSASTGRAAWLLWAAGGWPYTPAADARIHLRAVGPGALDLDGDGIADLTTTSPARIDYVSVMGTDTADVLDLAAFGPVALHAQTFGGGDAIAFPTRGGTTIHAPQVHAGAGDDTIAMGGQRGVALGGPGNDRLTPGSGHVIARLGPGDDTATGGPQGDWIEGGAGRDRLGGGLGGDMLRGDAGDDVLLGGDGGDDLIGGDGRDTITGGPGDELVRGGGDNDTVTTGTGDDRIDGEGGSDRIDAGVGNDSVVTRGWVPGASAPDRIATGAGNDFVLTEGVGDVIDTGAGDDYVEHPQRLVLRAGAGSDYVMLRKSRGGWIDLGPGADALILRMWMPARKVARALRVNCGHGRDWVDYSAVNPIGCEWHAQRDFWDLALGLPIRDDAGIPPGPPKPRDRGPRKPRPVHVKPMNHADFWDLE